MGDKIIAAGNPGEELYVPGSINELPMLIQKIKGREGTDVVLKIVRNSRIHQVTVPRVKTTRSFVFLGKPNENKILTIK